MPTIPARQLLPSLVPPAFSVPISKLWFSFRFCRRTLAGGTDFWTGTLGANVTLPWKNKSIWTTRLSVCHQKHLFNNLVHQHSNRISFGWVRLCTVPTDPDMEEDLVVVDDSDLDNGISDERDRVTSEISSSPSPSSAALPKIIGSDIRHTAVRCVPVEVEPKGKTPYTTSVNLKRGPKGYGFSVTWTHPPRYNAFFVLSNYYVYVCTNSTNQWGGGGRRRLLLI